MSALAGKRDFTAERGSTFDRVVQWSSLQSATETFTGNDVLAVFSLAQPPAALGNDKYLVNVYFNGFPFDSFAVHDAHLHFASPVLMGTEIRVVYKYAVPVDLTGYNARMQVRQKGPGGTILTDMTNSNGKIIINPLPGELRLFVAETETRTWAPGAYLYDLETVQGAYVTRLLEGKFTVKQNITET